MGVANVIPGVSGGTIAFITGIYERLIKALKNFDLVTFRLLLKGKFSELAQRTDLTFVAYLFAGVVVSVRSLAKALELALLNYEVWTLSFFFGLIISSIFLVSKQIDELTAGVLLFFLIGVGVAVGISFLPPATSNDSVLYLTLCGIVAVCSMILPGISGSYILLLMGNYLLVLQAISSLNLSILLPLLIGVGLGLILFSRFLSYLFAKFKHQTIALLTGFVAGSLLIIWPWKTTLYETFEGKEKVVGYIWNIPSFDLDLFVSLLLIALGYGTVWIIEQKSNGSIKKL